MAQTIPRKGFERRVLRAWLGGIASLTLGAVTWTGRAWAEPVEQLLNSSFDLAAESWLSSPNLVLEAAEGRLCAEVPAGAPSAFSAVVAQLRLEIVAGEHYRLSLDASASPGAQLVYLAIQAAQPPFDAFTFQPVPLEPTSKHFDYYFTAASSAPASLLLFVGGSGSAYRFCADAISLLSDTRYSPETGPRLRVNQLGYALNGPKRATLVTAATKPVDWQLLDASGQLAAQGTSEPRGLDPTSGLNLHVLDFDAVDCGGSGFTLVADGERSYPFELSRRVYDQLRTDALAVFYTQRSGTPILASVAGQGYARAAGHDGTAPNLGDTAVPCQSAEESASVYGEPWTCDYVLDVSGGWYDAGDHGKYVVNGGIAVAQLLSAYERTLRNASARRGALGDGTLRVPEHGNGVPDILDEARWELEWMLKMQVPEGQPLAGMVHHKVHDLAWTGLPLAPADDPNPRQLHRPSTAASLNLAAVAAQGARLFARYDRAFAARLLAAARRAWQAAELHPDLFAPVADGANGGGPYDDADVSDEFYWAAAELYLSTGERSYLRALRASPHARAEVFDLDGFAWGSVAALGRMDLATKGTHLPGHQSDVQSVVDAADRLITLASAQAWGQAYAPEEGLWVWGSNSQILNNLVVIATAYDLTGDPKYRSAALESMDYVLGRNALNRSYVTGYGEVFSQNQHSRMYSAELDSRLPHPPVGTLAGGPNSFLNDPLAAELLAGCAPQFCYVDEIQSWSTNELAINWNSALAWVASFLADVAHEAD